MDRTQIDRFKADSNNHYTNTLLKLVDRTEFESVNFPSQGNMISDFINGPLVRVSRLELE